jgi:hypothetical protein
MRLIALLITPLLFACNDEPVETPAPPVVVETPPPAPPNFQYHYSDYFMDAAATEDWIATVNTRIDDLSVAPTPSDFFDLMSTHFASDIEAQIGDPRVWQVGWQPPLYVDAPEMAPDSPTEGHAQLLQDSNRRMDAVEIWLELGRHDKVSECVELLKQDQEWETVAQVAILSDNDDLLFEITDKLVEIGWYSRVKKNIVLFALQQSDLKTARVICERYDWDLLEVVEDRKVVGDLAGDGFDAYLRFFALSGDEELLKTVMDEEMACLGEDDYTCRDFGRGDMVGYIVTLAERDPDGALEYARIYLANEHSEVFVWVESGEGEYLVPARGSLEFYKLIQGDDELRGIYESKLRMWLLDHFPLHTENPDTHPTSDYRTFIFDSYCEGMNGNCEDGRPNLVFTHMYRSREIPALRSVWSQALTGLEQSCNAVLADPDDLSIHQVPIFFIEYGRAALGEPFNPNREGLSLEERYVLARLQGVTPPPIFKDDGSMMEGVDYDFIYIHLVRGRLSEDARVRLDESYELLDDVNVFWALRPIWGLSQASWDGYDHQLSKLLVRPADVYVQNRRAWEERLSTQFSDQVHPILTESDVIPLYQAVLPNLRDKLPHQYEYFVARHPEWALGEEDMAEDSANPGQ